MWLEAPIACSHVWYVDCVHQSVTLALIIRGDRVGTGAHPTTAIQTRRVGGVILANGRNYERPRVQPTLANPRCLFNARTCPTDDLPAKNQNGFTTTRITISSSRITGTSLNQRYQVWLRLFTPASNFLSSEPHA